MTKEAAIKKFLDESTKGDFVGIYIIEELTESVTLSIIPKRDYICTLIHLKHSVYVVDKIYHIEGGDLHSIMADYTAKMESYQFNHPKTPTFISKVKVLDGLANEFKIDHKKFDHLYDNSVCSVKEDECV
jgi:hypothetical protein